MITSFKISRIYDKEEYRQLKYGKENAGQVNEIKERFGIAKDQTAIRIALHNFHRDYVVANKTFEPLKNGIVEKPKKEGNAN